jgi:hypothetical protein
MRGSRQSGSWPPTKAEFNGDRRIANQHQNRVGPIPPGTSKVRPQLPRSWGRFFFASSGRMRGSPRSGRSKARAMTNILAAQSAEMRAKGEALIQAAIIALFRVINRYVGNLAPMPGVFPDYKAPIVRNGADGHELATARRTRPHASPRSRRSTKSSLAQQSRSDSSISRTLPASFAINCRKPRPSTNSIANSAA